MSSRSPDDASGDRPLSTSLLANDADDQRLLAQVHPRDWRNPTPKSRYDLVVIGAGTAGLVTASIAAGVGARVALVERALMGGDCLNVGCVPSKAIIRAARAWRDARDGRERFGAPEALGDGDFARVMERMRRIRATMSVVDGAPRYRDLGIDVFFGDARFTSDRTIDVHGERLAFRRAVIATGSHPVIPSTPGVADASYLTNETIFKITSRPAHLIVLGAGAIGCELAQAFARLGSRVTIIDQEARVLMDADADASAIVEQALRRDGVSLLLGRHVTRVERRDDETMVELRRGNEIESTNGSTLLIAAGRAPTVDGLDLERAGVRFDARAGVIVDDQLRTTNRRIYAVGDVCSKLKLTHAADFQARMVVRNALFFGHGRASELVTPKVTYTSPEVARVGLSEADAQREGTAVDVVTISLRDVDRAVIDDESDGFCRVLVARGGGRIVGATIVAEHAGEMIGEVALAMTSRLGLAAIGRTMHPYPTQSEALRKAADAWERRKLTPVAKRVLGIYFRLLHRR